MAYLPIKVTTGSIMVTSLCVGAQSGIQDAL